MKFLAGFKTLFASLGMIGLGIAQGVGFTNIVGQYPGTVTSVIGVIALLLRLITNTASGVTVSVAAPPPAVVAPKPATPAPTVLNP